MNAKGTAHSEDLYIPAKEAAARLEVSLPTLYAYVSRGLIRSQGVPGSRNRRYWKVDIERLKLRRLPNEENDAHSGSGEETKITLLTEDGLYYRGSNVVELAETEPFESVAAFLWETDAKTIFTKNLPSAPPSFRRLRGSLGGLTILEQAMSLFPLIERNNPRSYDLSPSGFARTGADLLRWFAAILVGKDAPSDVPIHRFIAESLRAPKGFEDIIRRLLIVAADHEFDPTVYAVRAAANAGITPYYAVITGIIVSRGQRLRAGRIEAAARLLEEIVSIPDPRDSIVARYRNGEELAGFSAPGHRKMDPRTFALMSALRKKFGDDIELKRLDRAADTAAEISGAQIEFILPAIYVGRKLGFKGQELAVASMGRMAGWIAHAMEQYQGHPMIRPRARYAGLLPS
jgi:citrate synthase